MYLKKKVTVAVLACGFVCYLTSDIIISLIFLLKGKM